MEVEPGATSVTCRYCEHTLDVRPVEPRAGATPGGQRSRGPRSTADASGASSSPAGASVAPPSRVSRRLGLSVALGVFLPLVSGVAALRSFTAGQLASQSVPAVCRPNGTVRLVNVEHTGAGTLVEASLNCKVFIEKSKLVGDVIVKGAANVEVTIDDSVVEGKLAVIDASHNTRIKVRKGSRLLGSGVLIHGEANPVVQVEDAYLEGRELVRLGSNGELTALRSTLVAQHRVVAAGPVARVTFVESDARSEDIALEAGANLTLTLDHAALRGVGGGVESGPNARLRLSREAELSSDHVAFRTDSNLEALVEESRIVGKEEGLHAEANARITLRPGGTIEGETAVLLGVNAVVESTGGALVGGRTALRAGINAEVDLRRADVRGGVYALFFDRKPSKLVVKDGGVKGMTVLDGRERPSPKTAGKSTPPPRGPGKGAAAP